MTETTTGDPITLTPAAREKAAEYLKGDKGRDAVRVSFDDKGKLSLELDKLRPGDHTFVQGGVNVVIADQLVALLRGLTIDFGKNAEGKEGFQFTGPPTTDPELGRKAKDALAHPAGHHGDAPHGSPSDYLKVFYSLIVLTVLELGATFLPIGKIAIILLLMILAITKASLVGMYFMHLKFEGRWKHILLVPPALLAIVLIFALFPDVGRTGAWPQDEPVSQRPAHGEK